MNEKIAKIINKACRKETPAFKNEMKRTWNKVPRPMRNKFKVDLIASFTKQQEEANAE